MWKLVKTKQMRTHGLFIQTLLQRDSQPPGLAETQGREKVQSFVVGKRDCFRYAPSGGSWHRRVAGNLTQKQGCCFVAKSCPSFCDPMDYSPPGSSLHGISQARILEWVAISFCRGSSRPRDQTHVSCISRWIFTTEPSGKPRSRVLYVIVRGPYLTFSVCSYVKSRDKNWGS